MQEGIGGMLLNVPLHPYTPASCDKVKKDPCIFPGFRRDCARTSSVDETIELYQARGSHGAAVWGGDREEVRWKGSAGSAPIVRVEGECDRGLRDVAVLCGEKRSLPLAF